MKRIIALVLALALCLSLCACGKSEAATAYEELVAQIGTVTLDSEAAIKAAESAYNALTDKEKEQVAEAAATLETLRAEYDEAVTVEKVNQVVALIDAIGAVTLESEAAILAAEGAYNALTAAEQSRIADAGQTLMDARAAYTTAVNQSYADEVIAQIDAIGTVSLESEATIAAARAAFNGLAPEAQALVGNIAVLDAAEAEYNALWEAEKARIIAEYSSKFEIESDPVQNLTWYMHWDMPEYIDTRSYIIPYIGVQNGTPWICIRYDYTGDDWIFWEQLTIVTDTNKYYEFLNYFDVTRDNQYGVVWEYYDDALNYNQALDSEELAMLADIANSSQAIVRFEGDEYYYDLYVSETDKQIIRDTLALYSALLG